MGLVQYLVIVLMLSAQLVLTTPLTKMTYPDNDESCKKCPAGTFHKACTECEPCPAGSFTNDWNFEDSCHRCFGDCRADYHLKVVQNCTNTSDLKCVCEAGFKCTDKVPFSTVDNCRSCVPETPPTVAAAVTPGKKTPSLLSSGHSSTSSSPSSTPCQLPECQETISLTPSAGTVKEASSHHLTAILCPVIILGCVALVILICFCRSGDETCFKRAIAKLCNEEGQDASHKSKESSHQFPRDSFSAKQQPPCLSAANLGPVHLHNPGTVILSFLSQFTGHVGSTIDGGKIAETVGSEEEDERDCHVCHPTSSPSIHLSEEERSGEIDSIFFPSQEQGKDCHVSKEEEL